MITSTNETQVEPNAETAPTKRLLVSVKEVAAALGVSERTCWRWAATGEIPAPVRIGRSVRWHKPTLNEHLRQAHARAQRERRLPTI